MIVTGMKAVLALGAGVAGFQMVKPIYLESMAKVEVVRDVNEGQQVADAMILAGTEGSKGLSLRALKAGGYIQKIPKGWAASSPNPYKVLKSAEVCGRINDKVQTGLPEGACPPCPSTDNGTPACMMGAQPVMRPV